MRSLRESRHLFGGAYFFDIIPIGCKTYIRSFTIQGRCQMAKCGHNHEFNDEFRFCPMCGSPAIQVGLIKCQWCGHLANEHANYCPSCSGILTTMRRLVSVDYYSLFAKIGMKTDVPVELTVRLQDISPGIQPRETILFVSKAHDEDRPTFVGGKEIVRISKVEINGKRMFANNLVTIATVARLIFAEFWSGKCQYFSLPYSDVAGVERPTVKETWVAPTELLYNVTLSTQEKVVVTVHTGMPGKLGTLMGLMSILGGNETRDTADRYKHNANQGASAVHVFESFFLKAILA